MPNELIRSIDVETNVCRISIADHIPTRFIVDCFEFGCSGIDLKGVPSDVLAVPFFLNLAPVLWKSGGEYRSRYLDPALESSLESIRLEWQKRDGSNRWAGRLKSSASAAGGIGSGTDDAAAILFSGGVDSLATSLEVDSRQKALVLVRGNDIELENQESWSHARRLASQHAERIGASMFSIEANMYEFIDQSALDRTLPGSMTWWGSVQHGMGLTGLLAVPCWHIGAIRAVIAATHSTGFEGKAWGSTPATDELIQWGNVRVEHHGYGFSRQEKVRRIISFAEENGYKMEWRVCFRTTDGRNCGECEKCLRTGAAVLLEGHSPDSFGFELSAELLVERVQNLLESGDLRGDPNTIFHWQILKNRANDLYLDRTELWSPRARLVGLLSSYNLDRKRSRWAWRERIKTVSDRLFGIIPSLETPTRRLVERARKLKRAAAKKV